MSRVAGILRPRAALAAVLATALATALAGAVSGLLLPSAGTPVAAGVAIAVLAVVLMALATSMPVASTALPRRRARAALERVVPRTAQSDPDARGHARPRAPGRPLTAV